MVLRDMRYSERWDIPPPADPKSVSIRVFLDASKLGDLSPL
jgi:hypothetical protein